MKLTYICPKCQQLGIPSAKGADECTNCANARLIPGWQQTAPPPEPVVSHESVDGLYQVVHMELPLPPADVRPWWRRLMSWGRS